MWRRLAEPVVVLMLLGGVFVVLRGCQGPDRSLSPAQVAKVEKGMTERDVLQLLGPPSEPLNLRDVTEAMGVVGSGYRWRSGRRKLEVYFSDGRVAGTVAEGY